jgi:hypothetical protein
MNLNSLSTGPTTVGGTGPSTFQGSVTSLTGSTSVTISAPTVTVAPAATSADFCTGGTTCSFATGTVAQTNLGTSATQVFIQTASSSPTARLRLQTSSTAPVVSGVITDIGFTNTPAVAPSFTLSSRVNLNGLYHTYYSSACVVPSSSPTAFARLNCSTATAQPAGLTRQTNAPVTSPAAPTGGYDTLLAQWYPTQPGHYEVIISAVTGTLTPTPPGIRLQVNTGGGEDTYAETNTGTGVETSMTTSKIIKFDVAPSPTSYIFMEGRNLCCVSTYTSRVSFTVKRVA